MHDISESDDIEDTSLDELSFNLGSKGDNGPETEDTGMKFSFNELTKKKVVKCLNKAVYSVNRKPSAQQPSTSNLGKLSKLTKELECKDLCSEKINDKLAQTVKSGMKATFLSSQQWTHEEI